VKGAVKYFLLYLAAFCFLAPILADAQTGYFNQDSSPPAVGGSDDDSAAHETGGHTVVVTSIAKCYAQLGHAEELDIEQHYTMPYEECQHRLALKIKQDHEAKAGQQKNTGSSQGAANPQTSGAPAATVQSPPDNPPAGPPLSDEGLYYRVQKNVLPPPPPNPEDCPPPDNKTPQSNNQAN